MTKDEALKLATHSLAGEIIDALRADEAEDGYDLTAGLFGQRFSALVRRWATAELAQTEQEPVAEIVSDVTGCLSTRWYDEWTPNHGDKLYTSPPQRQPLTDAEIDQFVVSEIGLDADADLMSEFARAIEKAHGIGDKT